MNFLDHTIFLTGFYGISTRNDMISLCLQPSIIKPRDVNEKGIPTVPDMDVAFVCCEIN